MQKLLVIGRGSSPDSTLEDVATKVGSGNGYDFHVRRCASPDELPELVNGVASLHGPVELLELFDHGRRGSISMSDRVLFESDNSPASALTNWAIARKLSCSLAGNAQVRLVGCNTARLGAPSPLIVGSEGRLLLVKLAMELQAQRVVFGTITMTDAEQFDENGFTSSISLLFSSLAALDFDPPTSDQRDRNIEALLKPYTNRPETPPCYPQPGICERIRRVRARLISMLDRRRREGTSH